MYTQEEVYSKFPIGTKFICLNTRTEATITTGLFKITETCINEVDEKGKLLMTNGFYNCIYENQQWAKIIKSPINYSIY